MKAAKEIPAPGTTSEGPSEAASVIGRWGGCGVGGLLCVDFRNVRGGVVVVVVVLWFVFGRGVGAQGLDQRTYILVFLFGCWTLDPWKKHEGITGCHVLKTT